jgi:transcriptional regulator with XRE-family HTH domain
MDNIFDRILPPHKSLCQALGKRLRIQRVAQLLTQQELATRAGVSAGTVKNLERKGQSSMESAVRIAMALNLTDELRSLFKLRVRSTAQMQRAGSAQRVSRRGRQTASEPPPGH